VKVDAQQPVSATLIRIALILAITVNAMAFGLHWPASGLLPALGFAIPLALLWGWTELRLYRLRRSSQAQLEQMKMLTGSLAHDLRTPLCTALNAVGNLREATRQQHLDTERVERAYTATEKSLQRCHTLITAVLDFSRNGCNHLQPVWIDPWLETVVAEFPLPASISLNTRFNAQSQAALAPSQMRRAVHNLMENAVQAMMAVEMGEKDHRLEVTSRVHKARVAISVRDNGPGISTESQAKIFTPLYTEREDGVGLGLAIVQDVARQHAGRIQLLSPAGEGAQFTLELPRL
jgi:two-component system sensor histidine kinase FlrB